MKILKNLINIVLDNLNILIIYRFGKAVGDQLCLTAVTEIIKRNSKKKIVLFTSHPEIFYHNTDFYKIYSLTKNIKSKILLKFFKLLSCESLFEYGSPLKHINGKYFLQQIDKKEHLAIAHLANFSFKKDNNFNLSCKINFTDNELEYYINKFLLPKNVAVIQSETKKTFTNNKNWNINNFQNIVDSMSNINWCQIGFNEKKLNNTIDFTKNTNLREFSYIISKADFILCLESLYNHVASAFEKKVFMITSGFIPVDHVHYKNTIPILCKEKLECSPCYLLSECPIDNKPCTENISSSEVIKVIKENT